MSVLRMLIFDKEYNCRLDHRFTHPPPPPPTPTTTTIDNNTTTVAAAAATREGDQLTPTESMQLIMGMCYSLRTTLSRLVSSEPSYPVSFSYRTNRYRLAYYETASGWHFVMLTGLSAIKGALGSATYGGITFTLERALEVFFSSVFLEWVIRNPLLDPQTVDLDADHGPFKIKFKEFFTLPLFA